MKLTDKVKVWYKNTKLGYILLSPFKIIRDLYWFKIYPERKFLVKAFKRQMGHALDLNNPRTLNEKIQWLKLYDRTPLHTICADKLLVRDFVTETIGSDFLVPLVVHTTKVKELQAEKLPDYPFIIKANHNSGSYFIVRNKEIENWKEIRSECSKWLKDNFYPKSKEWQYKNIKPVILVEKLLLSESDKIPYDYKVHCFHGKARMIQVDMDRQSDKHCRNWYNTDWKREPYKWSSLLKGNKTDPSDVDVERPISLDRMIVLSEKLSKEFKYVRIDWYDLSGTLFFGEMTFHHDSGFRPVEPPEWDLKLGSLINLNNN